jgi:chromosome segregation ATPase
MSDPSLSDLDKKIDLMIQSLDHLSARVAEQREEHSRLADEHARRIGLLEQAKAQQDVAMATMQGHMTSATNGSEVMRAAIQAAAESVVTALAGLGKTTGPNWTAIVSAVVMVITLSAYFVDKIAH